MAEDYRREIGDALISILSKNNPRTSISVGLFDAEVVSVDINNRTCIVDSVSNNIDGLEVRLMPEISDGELEIPSIDSTVTVLVTEISQPLIVSKSWIDKKITVVGSQGYEINQDKQIFNDGSFGGIVKIKELQDNLNSLKDYIETLKSAIGTALGTIDTTAGSASQAPFNLQMASKVINFVDMENQNITHGEKLSS